MVDDFGEFGGGLGGRGVLRRCKSLVLFAHRYHLVSSFDEQNFHKNHRLSLSPFFLLYNSSIKSAFFHQSYVLL